MKCLYKELDRRKKYLITKINNEIGHLSDLWFDEKISDKELAQYWAQYHQAGTKPNTPEYGDILDKFTEDLQEGYRKGLIKQ